MVYVSVEGEVQPPPLIWSQFFNVCVVPAGPAVNVHVAEIEAGPSPRATALDPNTPPPLYEHPFPSNHEPTSA